MHECAVVVCAYTCIHTCLCVGCVRMHISVCICVSAITIVDTNLQVYVHVSVTTQVQ